MPCLSQACKLHMTSHNSTITGVSIMLQDVRLVGLHAGNSSSATMFDDISILPFLHIGTYGAHDFSTGNTDLHKIYLSISNNNCLLAVKAWFPNRLHIYHIGNFTGTTPKKIGKVKSFGTA